MQRQRRGCNTVNARWVTWIFLARGNPMPACKDESAQSMTQLKSIPESGSPCCTLLRTGTGPTPCPGEDGIVGPYWYRSRMNLSSGGGACPANAPRSQCAFVRHRIKGFGHVKGQREPMFALCDQGFLDGDVLGTPVGIRLPITQL